MVESVLSHTLRDITNSKHTNIIDASRLHERLFCSGRTWFLVSHGRNYIAKYFPIGIRTRFIVWKRFETSRTPSIRRQTSYCYICLTQRMRRIFFKENPRDIKNCRIQSWKWTRKNNSLSHPQSHNFTTRQKVTKHHVQLSRNGKIESASESDQFKACKTARLRYKRSKWYQLQCKELCHSI